MSRFRFSLAASILAASLLAATASGRQPDASEAADLTGKYTLTDGGYLVVSTDDFGRAQGFFERNGQFGRVTGRVVNGAISATWLQANGSEACETSVDGSPFWGKLTLIRADDGEVQISWGACEALPRVD